jgi:hypothetical protein
MPHVVAPRGFAERIFPRHYTHSALARVCTSATRESLRGTPASECTECHRSPPRRRWIAAARHGRCHVDAKDVPPCAAWKLGIPSTGVAYDSRSRATSVTSNGVPLNNTVDQKLMFGVRRIIHWHTPNYMIILVQALSFAATYCVPEISAMVGSAPQVSEDEAPARPALSASTVGAAQTRGERRCQ